MPTPRTSPATTPAVQQQAEGLRSPWRRLILWITGSSMAAVIISLLIHLGGAVIAANWLLGGAGGPGSHRGASDIELAVVTDTELTELQEFVSLDTQPIQASAEFEFEGGFEPPTFEASIADELVLGDDLGEIAPIGGASDGLGDGTGLGANIGGGGASFFGIEARGSRFAYIVDVSGSMNEGRLAGMQRELTRSIDGLLEHSSFAVVFYSSQARMLGGRSRWMRATQRHKTLADREIRAVTSNGGTQPQPAFDAVFKLRPKPDAIYFMTDGEFGQGIAAYVAQMNESSGQRTPIHCISFVERTSERLLRSIAEQSGGTYTHIPGPGK